MNEDSKLTDAQAAYLKTLEETGDGKAAVVAYYAAKERAEAEAPAPATTPNAPEAGSPAEAARAALAAQQERAELIAGARALIAANPETYGVTAEIAESLDEPTLLHLAGVETREVIDAQATDQKTNVEAAHAHSVSMLERRWWALSDAERRSQVDALGLDWETCVESKRRELERF